MKAFMNQYELGLLLHVSDFINNPRQIFHEKRKKNINEKKKGKTNLLVLEIKNISLRILHPNANSCALDD